MMTYDICLRPGMKAPDFTAEALMPSLDFGTVSLNQYKNKWLVLFSYEKDFSYVPPTELIELNKKLKEFKELNAEVIAISGDSLYAHNAWRMMDPKEGGIGSIDIPIISDLSHNIANSYGFYNTADNTYYSGTVIINPNEIVMSASYSMPEVGRSIAEALEFVKL